MSVIVGIKFDKGVLIGADTEVTRDNLKGDNITKIKASSYSNSAFGVAGRLRDNQIILNEFDDLMNYKDILDNKTIDEAYTINIIVPKLFKCLEKYQRLDYEDKIPYCSSNCLIATPYNFFTIDNDGAVRTFDNYAVIGCGDQLVKRLFRWN